jgi:hypothetical protein
MNFQSWFFSSSGKLILFVIVLVMSGINIFYQLNIYSCTKINEGVIKQNEEYTRQISQFENQEAYQNSTLFKEKQIRTEGYKYRGETVIDVSSIEAIPNDPNLNYIPKKEDQNTSNLQKWAVFLQDIQLNQSSVSCV